MALVSDFYLVSLMEIWQCFVIFISPTGILTKTTEMQIYQTGFLDSIANIVYN